MKINRIFYKDGYYCEIIKDIDESYENYIKRGNFIVSQKPKTNEDYNCAIVMSRIWINIMMNKSEYSIEINNIIKTMESNM